VLQRPLSLVSFISRVPAGNGSLWAVAIGALRALQGEAGYGMIPKKPVPDLIRDGYRLPVKIMAHQNAGNRFKLERLAR
jgi:hypothetical protein